MSLKTETLNGALLAWELPEQHHLRHKFGYWNMVERRMVCAQLKAEGVEPDEFNIGRRIAQNHAGDPSYRQTSDRRREAYKAKYVAEREVGLTKLELEFLSEHFDGANDPTAMTILEKVRSALLGGSGAGP